MGTKTIVKVLMSLADPSKKVGEYKTMGKCVDWLMGLDDWTKDMEELDAEVKKDTLAIHKRLF